MSVERGRVAAGLATIRRGDVGAGQRQCLLLEGDVLAAALGERDLQIRVAQTIVVVGLEMQRPLLLIAFQQGQAALGFDHANLGRTVGNRIDSMQALVGQRRCVGEFNSIQDRRIEPAFTEPVVTIAGHFEFGVVVEAERDACGLRIDPQAPPQHRTLRRLRIRGVLAARWQRRVSRWIDLQRDRFQRTRCAIHGGRSFPIWPEHTG